MKKGIVNQILLKTGATLLLVALTCGNAMAQEKKESADSSDEASTSKEEGNRNVMLNAASANGPREIQIGLPSADVNVLENGMLVTYATNPHSVNSLWRADASLSHVGLLKISETAITTGNIGYAVNSFTQLGEKGFHGTLNYKSNHFGMQEFSLNVNGGIGKDWYYSGSIYQDFDPGTFKIKSTPFQDRTQIYKVALTKKYNHNRGELTAIYHYSNSHPVYNYATQSAPFIYVGDGSVREFGDFALGTTSYLPVDNEMVYRDMRTGEVKKTNLYDATQNLGSMVTLMNNYTWDNGLNWKAIVKYDHSTGSCVYQTPMSLDQNEAGINYQYEAADGSLQPYTGSYVQSRMSCLNRGFINSLMFTSELSRQTANSTWRLGVNEWYYHIDYTSSTTMYDQSVPMDGSYPVRLFNSDFATYTDRAYAGNGYYTPLQSITGDRDFVPHVQVIQSTPHYMNFGYSEAYDSDYGNNPPRWEYSPQNGMNQLCLIDGTYVQGMWLRNWEYIRSFIVNKEFTFICILDDYYLHEGGFIVGFDRGHDIYSVYERDILEIFGTYGGQDNFYGSGFGAYGAAENAISIVRPKSGVMFMAITRDQGGQGWKTCRYNIGQYQASCTLNTVNFAEQFNASRIVFRPAGFRFFKFYLFDVHININELAANIHHFVSPS